MWCTEKNAETGRRGGAECIDESLVENRISSSSIDISTTHSTQTGLGFKLWSTSST